MNNVDSAAIHMVVIVVGAFPREIDEEIIVDGVAVGRGAVEIYERGIRLDRTIVDLVDDHFK